MTVTFAPGPSQTHPKLATFLAEALELGIPSMSHRSPAFAAIYQETSSALRTLLNIPGEYHIWFVGSATEAMERSVQSLVKKQSHHFVNGAFSKKFASIATQLGKTISVSEVNWGYGFGSTHAKVPASAELMTITQNETSTGVMVPNNQILQLRRSHPDTLIAVDVVSAVPHLELDYGALDVAFFSVQKGFGLPAGLGVIIASPRALEYSEKLKEQGVKTGSYHSFSELAKYEQVFNTPETPNVLAIYLLGRVANDLLTVGTTKLRRQLDDHAKKLYALLDRHPKFRISVDEPSHRSPTVIVTELVGNQPELFSHLAQHGLKVGSGYKHQKTTHVRIANFPSHLEHVRSLLDALETW